jgi:hypothetical protein
VVRDRPQPDAYGRTACRTRKSVLKERGGEVCAASRCPMHRPCNPATFTLRVQTARNRTKTDLRINSRPRRPKQNSPAVGDWFTGSQNKYDHLLREHVRSTGDINHAIRVCWTSDFDVHDRTVNLARNRKFETGRLTVDQIR